MANSYQLVAWTEKGQVRMIPSEIHTYMHEEMERIDLLKERIRYGTYHEVNDILQVSSACEKTAFHLLDLGQINAAFLLLAEAALCCTAASRINWADSEWGDILCKSLRGRFFAMLGQCKDLVHEYPNLRYTWEDSGLRQACKHITGPFDLFELEWTGPSGDMEEAVRYNKALRFGKDEVYRCRR